MMHPLPPRFPPAPPPSVVKPKAAFPHPTPSSNKKCGIDWQKDLKDTMWSMFWIKQNVDQIDIEADKEVLKKNVARLIRMSTQKNAGQRGVKDCLDWDSLDTTLMMIACSATSLCLSGALGEMPETIEGDF